MQYPVTTYSNFMVSLPPGSTYIVSDFANKSYRDGIGRSWIDFNTDDLFDYCESETCRGMRLFTLASSKTIDVSSAISNLTYRCKNCGVTLKRYGVIVFDKIDDNSYLVVKVGQYPAFGPPVPTRAIQLVGPEREIFLKGRRAENIGLGIAAFAYYRRVIESQWQRFLDEIIKVGEKTGLDVLMIQKIRSAKDETQFGKAVASMGEAIPPSLKLNGQNPLILLFAALSEGLHSKTDEQCLELASDIRVILYEFAERLNLALQEHNELDAAVKRLSARNNSSRK